MIGKYSLWFMPEGKIYDKLSDLIAKIAEEYRSSKFPPHVSLLEDVAGEEGDIISKAGNLADRVKPFTIKLLKIDCRDNYFQSLIIKVEKSKELSEADLIARELFGRESSEYFPHVSLMYSEFPREVKEKIIEGIGKLPILSFEVKTLYLFEASGAPEEWREVISFRLNSGQ